LRECDPQGIDLVVGEINLTFTGSARFDELVLVDTGSRSKTEIPDWVRAGLEPYLSSGVGG
jgi:acyl-CoA thioesterase FadM